MTTRTISCRYPDCFRDQSWIVMAVQPLVQTVLAPPKRDSLTTIDGTMRTVRHTVSVVSSEPDAATISATVQGLPYLTIWKTVGMNDAGRGLGRPK